ncbi:hypothetical protein Bind_3916 (plasmid) [Beijerinckia indica subsp. indica ATCC 9039]|uniref:Uncharacterized protein n=1 Tax=Beijerinckia indica subsp. indica (strain ATCC 9039 / DSM 1715 / NCIMB 8712) TaxID=395963 RepID=B2ILP1_BEII9|nr:hypothetical protein Bind_3916 [Beijerinckia indica subsp. indica ATCC 9039]
MSHLLTSKMGKRDNAENLLHNRHVAYFRHGWCDIASDESIATGWR